MTDYRNSQHANAQAARAMQLDLARRTGDARMRTVHRKAARAWKRAALVWA